MLRLRAVQGRKPATLQRQLRRQRQSGQDRLHDLRRVEQCPAQGPPAQHGRFQRLGLLTQSRHSRAAWRNLSPDRKLPL
ncbi:hypothetical protein ACF8R4_01685 [Pseudomonas sp. FYR_2]|uniref:hypothetical protein n=1 Tax=Pseudomonas TaxID=286 RepID=UPI00346203F9